DGDACELSSHVSDLSRGLRRGSGRGGSLLARFWRFGLAQDVRERVHGIGDAVTGVSQRAQRGAGVWIGGDHGAFELFIEFALDLAKVPRNGHGIVIAEAVSE